MDTEIQTAVVGRHGSFFINKNENFGGSINASACSQRKNSLC